ncbi:DNA polymerase I [Candidatus Saccharibacteria bacterium CG10_big_fil_rev_8_21_14_0_10_47_8]|nr:MAG: DNA polymerase I [Candidatus Saccharibacteria bacterium CG10_big_fil_rev_8_21_14_0_10_47_8]
MAEARKKLAIIDGKSVFYRGYYAMPNLSTREGIPTGGVYGFAAMALELIRKLKPDYVCVAWDKPKTNIRKRLEMYPQYKAGRKAPPPDFYAQIPLLHELLEAFSWPLYELDDYEADDIMGAFAVQAREKDVETMLITSDLDALQLVNGHTHVYALKKGFTNIELFHPESFEQKYGIGPEQFLDLKALKGDSSDNIPGVPGVGEKTALELIKSYKTLDGVYENLGLIKPTLKAKLEAGKDLAYLSKKLACIWTDAPIKLNLKEMDGTKIDTGELRDMLQKLEFKSLLGKLPSNMQTDSHQSSVVSRQALKLPKNVLIESDKNLPKLDLDVRGLTSHMFVHSRAAGRHGTKPQALILGDEKTIYTLDLTKLNPEAVRKTLTTIYHLPTAKLVGYDVKSDIKVLHNIFRSSNNSKQGGAVWAVEHDVLVGAYLINALVRAQSLTDLAIDGIGYEGAPFEDLPTEDFIIRAPETMAVIAQLYERQAKELANMPKVSKLAQDVEWPVIPVIADMELEGIKLDCSYLNKFSKELEDSISDLEQNIYGHADFEFNISSPAQLADVLFSKLNLPTQFVKKTKTGHSTAASELSKLRGLHPVIDLISQYREVTKLKNTYVDTLPTMVDENSRVHTTFNLTTAPTGRLSSVDPNLQNIPVRTELGNRIRTAFVAEKGNVLISADYSQFELRLAAVLADDKGMIEAFNKDEDIHVLTAADVLGIRPEDVTKQQRYEAKAVNFGILYGQGPHGLAEGTGMAYGAARDFIKKYFEVRPKLKEYIEKTREKATNDGYVETLLGRRRPTPDVKSSNFVVREGAFRAAVNMPVQGTAADLTKLAMIKIQQKLDQLTAKSSQLKAVNRPRILLQIHDSLLIECGKDDAKIVGDLLKDTMENIYKLPVKLKVDITSGKNWGKL